MAWTKREPEVTGTIRGWGADAWGSSPWGGSDDSYWRKKTVATTVWTEREEAS